MGNCGAICKYKFLGLKGDIILEKNSNNDTGKYLETEYIQKIIHIQKSVKQFLKKKKSSKIKLHRKASPKSPKHKRSTQQKKSKLKKSTKSLNSPTKNASQTPQTKYITYDEDQKNTLLIPTINSELFNINLFNEDAFRQQKISLNQNQNTNDPRDGPFDNKRRKYPKITEDQSSYEGEWKNGKRDGFGILCFGEEAKFMGLFKNDTVVGYGKLWQDNGDIYKGYWKDFQAEGYGM